MRRNYRGFSLVSTYEAEQSTGISRRTIMRYFASGLLKRHGRIKKGRNTRSVCIQELLKIYLTQPDLLGRKRYLSFFRKNKANCDCNTGCQLFSAHLKNKKCKELIWDMAYLHWHSCKWNHLISATKDQRKKDKIKKKKEEVSKILGMKFI